MKRRRINTILILLTLAVVVIFGSAIVCMDSALPKDGDLRPVKLDVPDEENAFSFLAEAGRQFSETDYAWESMPLDSPNAKFPWRDDVAQLMLGQNTKALELAEKALSCRLTRAPGADIELLLKIWKVCSLLRLRGDLHCRQGEYREGFDSYLEAVRFAHLVETSGTGFWESVTIPYRKIRLLEHMTDCLASAHLDHGVLAEYTATLSANRVTDEQFIEELKADYVAALDDVDRLRDPDTLLGLRHCFPELRYVPFTYYHYQPNRTKRKLAEIFRNASKNLPKDCRNQPRRILGLADWTYKYSTCHSTWGMIPSLFKRNAIGSMYYAPAAGQISDAIWARQEGNLRISALQILMALKCHKRDSGQLPRSLGELVPAHLSAIPADDYDGKPLRYSPEKKMIYSVGEDLTDDGGSADKDIVFKIGF